MYPSTKLNYEDSRYTATIHLAESDVIITDGKNFDELMKNIDDAMVCRFDL